MRPCGNRVLDLFLSRNTTFSVCWPSCRHTTGEETTIKMSQANVEAMMDFGKLMSEMEVNMAGAVADIVREQNQVYDKHHLTTTCTYFGKARGAQLRSCTRCK